jgi:hypothetical protein
MMNSLPKRGQRTATNKASKAKMAMPAKKMPAKSNKMPPALLMIMKAKAK